MIDEEEAQQNKDKWERKLERMKLGRKQEQSNMIDGFGKTKTIDDFKGTQAYAKYKAMCEQGAKARKNKTFFGGGTK